MQIASSVTLVHPTACRAATCMIGTLAFGEAMNLQKAFCIGLIVAGVIGLNLSGA